MALLTVLLGLARVPVCLSLVPVAVVAVAVLLVLLVTALLVERTAQGAVAAVEAKHRTPALVALVEQAS